MTNKESGKTTQQKILDTANSLFAKNGFSGTSIRDIATNAGVNLAAINYHFTNKENLYWQVFAENIETIRKGVRKSGERTESTADLAVDVFKFFISSESAVMNTFKIFLSDSVALPEDNGECENSDHVGPPGQDIFLEKIKHDLGEDYPLESYQWAIKMIFSLILHFGIMMNTSIMKRKCKNDETFGPEKFEKAIRHSVNAHLEYLIKHKTL